MEGFGLLVGHLLGDYILQEDWQAKNKTPPPPGKEPHPNKVWLACAPTPVRQYPGPWSVDANPHDRDAYRAALEERNRRIDEWNRKEDARVAAEKAHLENDPVLAEQRAWWAARDACRRGHLARTVHCLLYTLAVALCSFWWMPWWGLVVCFAAHWPIDRFRLAKVWMERVSGQKAFATGPLAPWSVIVVDNTIHLLTLFLIAVAAGRVGC